MAEDSLKKKAINGTAWSAIDNCSQYIVSFTVGIVLARLLSPDDYGLVGLTYIFTNISSVIINGGFQNALIRKKKTSNADYNTVFIINFVVSLFLYLILFWGAKYIANYFGRQELTMLVRISSLNIILGALAIVPRAKLIKNIDFKTQTKITLVSTFFSGIIGILLAFAGYGVWALVAQNLLMLIFTDFFFWKVNKWIPRIQFNLQSFKELFGYSWKLLASSILDSIWKEMYQVVVGKYYSPATLGQYTRAKHYAQLFSSNLTNIIQRVSFPILSEIQDDKERMKMAYRKIIKETMFVTFLLMFFLGSISEPLIHFMIGEKWHEASIYLPYICFLMALYPLHAINLNMLQVQGRSDLFLILEILKKIIAIIPIVIGIKVGILPMLVSSIIVGIISYFLNSIYSGKMIGYSTWMQLKDISSSFGVASCMAFSVYFIKYIPIPEFFILMLQVLIGTLLTILFSKIFRLKEYDDIVGIIKSIKKKK